MGPGAGAGELEAVEGVVQRRTPPWRHTPDTSPLQYREHHTRTSPRTLSVTFCSPPCTSVSPYTCAVLLTTAVVATNDEKTNHQRRLRPLVGCDRS